MTVDSLDIKNNFTVAGGTPVTGDDLQKVQDQIIAPEQYIYVDAGAGNDNNDGTLQSKPVKTLERAKELIKTSVPTIRIRLANSSKQYIYETTPFDFFGTSVTTFDIQQSDWSGGNLLRPIIKLKYGNIKNQGLVGGGFLSLWGNALVGAVNTVNIGGIVIQIDGNKPITTDYKNFIANTKNLTVDYCDIQATNYCLCVYSATDCTLNMINTNFASFSGYLWEALENIERYKNDPSLSEQNYEIEPYVVERSTYSVLTALADRNTNLTNSVTNLGNSGISNSVYTLYKNWS
ncbi:hypothetical protein INF25_09435 [Megamonas funiformis]|nr:hypothetical protein [Megamonas funiformis]